MSVLLNDSEISSLDLLEDLVQKAFGSVTVDKEKWHVNRSELPGRTFFRDRMTKHEENPINYSCAEYLETLFAGALEGSAEFKQESVSTRLISILESSSGLTLSASCLKSSDDVVEISRKNDTVLELLRLLLLTAQDRASFKMSEVRIAFEMHMGTAGLTDEFEQSMRARLNTREYGLVGFYYDVDSVGYSEIIRRTNKTIDITHLHGVTWTNMCKAALSERMSEGHLHVRVALLSPHSRFYEPYEEFCGYKSGELARKTTEAVEAWKDSFNKAKGEGAHDISLKIYFHKSFPAKAIYRFDNRIFVTPGSNSSKDHQFMCYECENVGKRKSPFSKYSKELNKLISDGSSVWDSSNQDT